MIIRSTVNSYFIYRGIRINLRPKNGREVAWPRTSIVCALKSALEVLIILLLSRLGPRLVRLHTSQLTKKMRRSDGGSGLMKSVSSLDLGALGHKKYDEIGGGETIEREITKLEREVIARHDEAASLISHLTTTGQDDPTGVYMPSMLKGRQNE